MRTSPNAMIAWSISFFAFFLLLGVGGVHAEPAPDSPVRAGTSLEERMDRLEERMESLENTIEERLGVPEVPSPAVGSTSADTAEPTSELSPDSPTRLTESSGDGEVSSGGERTGFGSAVRVLEGEVVDEAVSFGGPVIVDGHVLGDAVSFGGDVVLGPQARVDGDAVSFGGVVRARDGARVAGDRIGFARAWSSPSPESHAWPALPDWSRMADTVRRLVVLLCMAGLGVLVIGMVPRRVENIAVALRRGMIRHALAGFVLALATSLAVALLSIIVVGLPLALLFSMIVALLVLLGFVGFCQALGEMLPLPRRLQSAPGAFVVGLLLLAAFSMVPILGTILLVLVSFPALGAATATRFGQRAPSD